VSETSSSSPVFYDPRGRRRRHARRTYLAIGILATTLAVLFIASVLANPLLPRLNLRPLPNLPHATDIQPGPGKFYLQLRVRPKQRRQKSSCKKRYRKPGDSVKAFGAYFDHSTAGLYTFAAPASFSAKQLAIGFYINWDESSFASLERNLDHLDWVVPQWVYIRDNNPGEGPLQTEIDAKALNLIREKRPQTQVLPMIQNLNDEEWQKDVLARAVGDEESRQRLINALAQFVEQNKFAGVCVDFEEVTKETQPNLLLFMQELHAAFQPHGWSLCRPFPSATRIGITATTRRPRTI
jgi:hypothetical protein